MKKTTLIASVMLFASFTANAQTGFCTAATNANAESTFNWADAQNFCPILVSDAVSEAITTAGIKLDLRIDDTNRFLYIWPDGTSYTAAEATGTNSFGDFGGYFDMVVGSVGWSGLGFIDTKNTIDFSFLDEGGYYFHFGTKGEIIPHCIGFCDGKFSIGDNAFVDGGKAIKNLGNWNADGEWYYFDVPLSAIYETMGGKANVFTTAQGGQTAYKNNYFWTLSGGTTGKHLVIENAFLYQKKSDVTGINAVTVADDASEVYDIQGRKVSNMNKSGVYVVKTAQGTKKVAVK